MHPETKKQREKYDLLLGETIKNYRKDSPEKTIEEILHEYGFRVDVIYANIPTFESLVETHMKYVIQREQGKFSSYISFPAWWLPSVMERIVEKEFLPFVFYVKE